MTISILQIGSGLIQSASQIAALAGSIVLVLMIVAMVGIAYRHFREGGIEWPDDDDSDTDGGVRSGDSDDEWEYY